MIAVQNDFQTRADEVSRYFVFLRLFEEQRVVFRKTRKPPKAKLDTTEQTALFKTLKANGFLLLYNLMESTLKNAIEAIFDDFGAAGVSFDHCSNDVRRLLLKMLKAHDVDKILPSIANISVDVVVKTFRKEKLFSGNVDARRIREVADEYGFRRPRKKSNELLTVKNSRNDLAHGNKSFAEVGREYDLQRLERIKVQVISVLEELLAIVAEYIKLRTYLSGTAPAAPSKP